MTPRRQRKAAAALLLKLRLIPAYPQGWMLLASVEEAIALAKHLAKAEGTQWVDVYADGTNELICRIEPAAAIPPPQQDSLL